VNEASEFRLPEDAIEIGYEIGCNLRHAGARKAGENRKLGFWAGDRANKPDFVFWQMGFRAGYRGSPKPGAPAFEERDSAVTPE